MRLRLALVATVALCGCSTAGSDQMAQRDPLQKFNRRVWAVNDGIDTVVLKPVSSVYRAVLPRVARTGVTNVLENLTEPWSAANNLLQLQPKRAAQNLKRFAVNTTIGFGGLRDHATKIGIKAAPEDFGQTLGSWGVGTGPYLVLPLLGPSTLRDGVGLVVGQFADPVQACVSNCGFSSGEKIGFTALKVIDGRAVLTDEGIDALLKTSADPYAVARLAYLQSRQQPATVHTPMTQDGASLHSLSEPQRAKYDRERPVSEPAPPSRPMTGTTLPAVPPSPTLGSPDVPMAIALNTMSQTAQFDGAVGVLEAVVSPR
jgi:phospholipid-binding lipoprotein MlaA